VPAEKAAQKRRPLTATLEGGLAAWHLYRENEKNRKEGGLPGSTETEKAISLRRHLAKSRQRRGKEMKTERGRRDIWAGLSSSSEKTCGIIIERPGENKAETWRSKNLWMESQNEKATMYINCKCQWEKRRRATCAGSRNAQKYASISSGAGESGGRPTAAISKKAKDAMEGRKKNSASKRRWWHHLGSALKNDGTSVAGKSTKIWHACSASNLKRGEAFAASEEERHERQAL